ncbi:5-hydroxytryptamine receptor 3A-like [Toxotes jaculatrix]|uniref:5-hydroxytryptamine receptor 3A-like n=1 Tax=Toxotes jaculatrix TaxID=941984 RepID=UPI001B3AF207|nr:5-hydroxytryptamine receptor 3A-like [Toxotes jaculatrix]
MSRKRLDVFSVDGVSSAGNCSYYDVLKHLNLNHQNLMFSVTRPVNNHTTPTQVHLDLLLHAILEVKEKDQIFVPYVWVTMWWKNDFIDWKPDEFCGITTVSVPNEMMWKPDLTIEEMTEKDKAAPSPYLAITNEGNVELTNDQVLVSICKMRIYKFPFDTQSCSLTFKSAIHSVEEMELIQYGNSSMATKESREVMRSHSEWLFINITVTSKVDNHYKINQSLVIYTINMKRRSALYVINFILPVLFFLCLDLASFLISDRGGEKLSFKVTVLLAVTVMQLILNEILPSSSDRIPLIAVYCIGIFALMMLSLLETIVVMYLMEKDSESQDNETDKDQSYKFHREVNKLIHSTSDGFDVSPGKTPSELLDKEGSSRRLMEEFSALEKFSDELREAMKIMTLLLNDRKEGGKPGYWTRMTKKINRLFFIFYVISATMFLLFLFLTWIDAKD